MEKFTGLISKPKMISHQTAATVHDRTIYSGVQQAFLGGPEVKPAHVQSRGQGFDPGWGTKIPCATWHSQKILKKKAYLHKYCIFFHNNSRNLIRKSIEFLDDVLIY